MNSEAWTSGAWGGGPDPSILGKQDNGELASDAPGVEPEVIPRTFSEIHQDVWDLVRRAPWVFVALPAIVNLPVDFWLETRTRGRATGFLAALRADQIYSLVPELLVGSLISAVYLGAMLQIAAGEQTNLRSASQRGFELIGRVFIVNLSVRVLVGLGTLICVVPGVYYLVRTSLAVPAAVFDGLWANSALAQSAAKVRGSEARICLGVLGAGLLYLPFALAPSLLTPGSFGILGTVIAFAPLNILVSWVILGLALMYLDRRGGEPLPAPVGRGSSDEPHRGRRGVLWATAMSILAFLGSTAAYFTMAFLPSHLGDLAWERNDYDLAQVVFEVAILWDPEDAYSHYSIAWCHWMRGEKQVAAGSFAQAVLLVPEDPNYRADFVMALTQDEYLDEARLHLEVLQEQGLLPGTRFEELRGSLDQAGERLRSSGRAPRLWEGLRDGLAEHRRGIGHSVEREAL